MRLNRDINQWTKMMKVTTNAQLVAETNKQCFKIQVQGGQTFQDGPGLKSAQMSNNFKISPICHLSKCTKLLFFDVAPHVLTNLLCNSGLPRNTAGWGARRWNWPTKCWPTSVNQVAQPAPGCFPGFSEGLSFDHLWVHLNFIKSDQMWSSLISSNLHPSGVTGVRTRPFCHCPCTWWCTARLAPPHRRMDPAAAPSPRWWKWWRGWRPRHLSATSRGASAIESEKSLFFVAMMILVMFFDAKNYGQWLIEKKYGY